MISVKKLKIAVERYSKLCLAFEDDVFEDDVYRIDSMSEDFDVRHGFTKCMLTLKNLELTIINETFTIDELPVEIETLRRPGESVSTDEILRSMEMALLKRLIHDKKLSKSSLFEPPAKFFTDYFKDKESYLEALTNEVNKAS